ncbi:oxidoreductase [Aureococcus anophagefferens]|nr:oxidoreductase [Aureococcus anophagefferens]
MKRILDVQKKAFIANGAPSTQERIRRIDVAIKLLLDNADALCAAVDEDFGGRPVKFTKFVDVATVVDGLKNARAHVAKWSAPHRRGVEFPMNLAGASNAVEYVPKGVVGVISPWNYPVSLLFNPLAGIFAAGNSAMLKPSEFVPKTAELVRKLVAEAYDESVCCVVTGHADVAATFSSLPFDHLMYTGSAPASGLAHGKVMNAGQTCIAPDVVFVPAALKQPFADAFKAAVADMFPAGVAQSGDYTSVISDAHYERATGLVAEAEAAGVEVLVCPGGDAAATGGGEESKAGAYPRRMAPTLVFDPADDLKISGEEIFGPPMVVRTYDAVEDAVAYVNARPRPLACYYFGTDAAEEAKVLPRITAGGVCVNDVIMHVAQEDLPFGGVGGSGYRSYHGHEGFLEFSHHKGVHRQVATGRQFLLQGIYPPYDKKGSMLDMIIDMKLTPAKDSKLPCCIL